MNKILKFKNKKKEQKKNETRSYIKIMEVAYSKKKKEKFATMVDGSLNLNFIMFFIVMSSAANVISY